MAKKKKPIPPEVKLRRKIKKYTRRTIILGLIVVGYFLLLPILVPSYAPQINTNKKKLIQAATEARNQAYKILGTATQVSGQLSTATQKVDEEGGVETVLQSAIDDFKSKVKALPKEQVKRVKREFCSDILEEIEQAPDSSITDNQE